MEGCAQFNSEADDLTFSKMNQRRLHANPAFFGALPDQVIECLVIGWPAVGVARAVLLDGAD